MPISFKKRSGITISDVDNVVSKLKSLYNKYAEQYGSKTFNLQSFAKRYKQALINKVNLKSFLNAEIIAFEELKKRVERNRSVYPKTPVDSGPSYSEIADRIVEENLQKIRKYKCIDFHPDAEEETKYLLGAVTDFYYGIWGKISKLVKYLEVRSINDFLNKLENDFSYYIVPVGGQYSRAVDDYLLVLSRKDPRDNERAAVNFMKYGGILLNNCLKVVNDGLNFLSNKQEYQKEFIELKGYKDILISYIDNFRLSDIRDY